MPEFKHLEGWVPEEMDRILVEKREKYGPIKSDAHPMNYFAGLKVSMGKLLHTLQKKPVDFEEVKRKALHTANFAALMATTAAWLIPAETTSPPPPINLDDATAKTAIAGTPADPPLLATDKVDKSSVEVASPEIAQAENEGKPDPADSDTERTPKLEFSDFIVRKGDEISEEAEEVKQKRGGIKGEG